MLDPTAVLVVVFAVVIVVLYVRRNSTNDAGKRYPPSIPALPLLGSIPFFTGGLDRMPSFLMRKAEQLGPVMRLYAARRMAISLNGREAIANAYEKHADIFADRPDFWTEANILNPDLREYVCENNLPKVATRSRTRILPLRVLPEFGFGTNQEMDIRISQEIEDSIKVIRLQNGRPFDPTSTLLYATTNVVMSILFGSESQTGIKRSKLIDDSYEVITNLDTRIEYAPFIRFLPTFRKKIEHMTEAQKRLFAQFDIAIEHNKKNSSERNFVSRFLEIEGPNYSHQDLLYILRDLCFASADTMEATLMWALLELANNPDIQSRLHSEIDEVCGGNRLPSIDDKPRLPYTEAVMLEVMRRHTLVANPVPRSAMKDTELCGYFIPRGCMAISNLYSVHMDPKVWGDPETFRPERFLDQDSNVIRRNDIIPFGLGRRTCTGKALALHELFLFLADLVKHFDILPPDGEKCVTVSEKHGLITSPTSFKIRMIPRC